MEGKSIRDFAKELKCDPYLLNTILLSNDIKIVTEFGKDDGFISFDIYNQVIKTKTEWEESLLDEEQIKAIKSIHIPITKGSWNYFLFDGDTLVYIGQTNQLLYRIDQHLSTKKFTEVSVLPVNPKTLMISESFYIYKFKPFYNLSSVSDESYIRLIFKLSL